MRLAASHTELQRGDRHEGGTECHERMCAKTGRLLRQLTIEADRAANSSGGKQTKDRLAPVGHSVGHNHVPIIRLWHPFRLSDWRASPTLSLDCAEARDSRCIGDALSERILQLEIFPEVRHIEALDPRVAIGPDTRVDALFRVRYGEARQVHQVYRDRHGWYCAEHGPACTAVSDAVNAASPR